MKPLLAAVTLLLALSPVARADDATKQIKVEKLFAAMHLDRLTDQMMTAVQGQVSTMMNSMPGMDQVTPAQKQLLAEMQQKSSALVREVMGWKALEPEMVKLYASVYSEQEIDGILAFYTSPIGQKMVEKTPELTSESMKIAQGKMVELQPRMTNLMQEYQKKLQDAGPPPAAKTGSGR